MYQACEKLQKFPAYLNHHSKRDHFTINNSTRKQTYRESVHSARECFDWQWQFCQNHPEKLVLALAVNPSQSSTSACHVTNAVSIFFIIIKWYNKSHFLLLIKTAVQCWLWTTPQISLYLKRQFTKPKTHYGLFFRMTWVSQQQNGKTIPDVNESKDDASGTTVAAATPYCSIFTSYHCVQARCSSWYPINSIKALRQEETVH